MKRIGRLAVAAVALGAILNTTAVKAAAPPRIEMVAATYQAAPSVQDPVFCQGAEGNLYQDNSGTSLGTVTSSDPRLSGDLTITYRTLGNVQGQSATASGTFLVEDPATGSTKVSGRFFAVGTLTAQKGAIFARVSPAGSLPGGTLFANTSFTNDLVTGEISGEIGGTPSIPTDASAIQSGAC